MLKKFTLLRSQRNRVYEMLREARLEPGEFAWGTEEIAASIVVSRLNYHEGTFYFQFSSHEVNAWCVLCPGMYRSLDHEYPRTWEEQEGAFRKWTSFLKREIKIPDFWAELARYRLALRGQPPNGMVNEPIPACDADRIGQALSRLAERIEASHSAPESSTAIQNRLGYLAEAARRLRSVDWLHAALGVCAAMAMELSLSEHAATALWELVENDVGQFVHLTAYPPQGSTT